MEMTSVPIIVVCCYVLGELYKVLFKKETGNIQTDSLSQCFNRRTVGDFDVCDRQRDDFRGPKRLDCVWNRDGQRGKCDRRQSNHQTIIFKKEGERG